MRIENPAVFESGALRLPRQAEMRSTEMSGFMVMPNCMAFLL